MDSEQQSVYNQIFIQSNLLGFFLAVLNEILATYVQFRFTSTRILLGLCRTAFFSYFFPLLLTSFIDCRYHLSLI